MFITLLHDLALAWLDWARINLAYAIYPQDYMWAALEAEDHYLNEAINALGSECEYMLWLPYRLRGSMEAWLYIKLRITHTNWLDLLQWQGFSWREANELWHIYICKLTIIESLRLKRLVEAGVLWPNSQAHCLLLSCNVA